MKMVSNIIVSIITSLLSGSILIYILTLPTAELGLSKVASATNLNPPGSLSHIFYLKNFGNDVAKNILYEIYVFEINETRAERLTKNAVLNPVYPGVEFTFERSIIKGYAIGENIAYLVILKYQSKKYNRKQEWSFWLKNSIGSDFFSYLTMDEFKKIEERLTRCKKEALATTSSSFICPDK